MTPNWTICRKPRHKTHWQVYTPDGELACECGGEATAKVIASELTGYYARMEAHCCQTPHVSVNATFVSYGYQVDIIVNGEPRSIGCRDFGDDHEIPKLIESFVEHAERAIEAFRKGK